MSIKLIKAQRHAIYKEALKRFDEIEPFGLCQLLCDCGAARAPFHQEMPELEKLRPKNAHRNGYWWPRNREGYAARKRALKKCIELSKPTQRKKS